MGTNIRNAVTIDHTPARVNVQVAIGSDESAGVLRNQVVPRDRALTHLTTRPASVLSYLRLGPIWAFYGRRHGGRRRLRLVTHSEFQSCKGADYGESSDHWSLQRGRDWGAGSARVSRLMLYATDVPGR